MKTRLFWVFVFAAGILGLAVAAMAQSDTAAPPASTTTPPAATTVATAPPTGPAALPAVTKNLDFKLAALASDTFVMVKDQGEYQTVIVYKVTPMGKVQQTDRRNFFYAAP